MRLLKTTLAIIALSASSLTFAAGTCGAGKITHIKEGGWNSDDFMIRIDYTAESSVVGGEWNSQLWIRFSSTLDPLRLNGIKALAYMAFTGGKTVRAYTSGTQCQAADDLTLYAANAAFPNPPTTP